VNPAVALIPLGFEDGTLNNRALPGAGHRPLLDQTPLQPARSFIGADDRPQLIRCQIDPIDPVMSVNIPRHRTEFVVATRKLFAIQGDKVPPVLNKVINLSLAEIGNLIGPAPRCHQSVQLAAEHCA
jgi:hypothetical protein